MHTLLQNDKNQLNSLLEKVKNQSLDFLNNVDEIPTTVNNIAQGKSSISNTGHGASLALDLFNEKFKDIIISSTGPRYWGYVTGGATPAAILGDWLASIYDQNTQTNNGQGDISASIEFDAIHLLLELFGLPKDFLGGFVTGATMSNFTCLGVARQWYGKTQGIDIAKDGISNNFKILTANAHSSTIKSLAMLGIGSKNSVAIKTLEGTREAIDTADLKEKIEQLNGQPFILISSAGTVNTVDFDDFKTIAQLRDKHKFWWHIDAAFGGFAACSPKHKHLLDGWEQADSITIDCHKWLNVPYESAFYLIKDEHKFLQVETFQNSNAPYLGDPLEDFNYLNFLPENSRRLRALPAWFTLMAYGREGYQDIVERNINLANKLGSYIDQSDNFELLAPVRLNTVCFTLSEDHNNSVAFLERLNNTGKVFMTPTVFNGKKGIRAALVNWRTSEEDIDLVIDLLKHVI